MGNSAKLALHIHPRHGEVGLNYQYWVVPVYSLFLERGLFYYDLRLNRVATHHKPTKDKPCETDENYDMYECVKNRNAKQFMNQSQIDAHAGCAGVQGKLPTRYLDQVMSLTLIKRFSLLDTNSIGVH